MPSSATSFVVAKRSYSRCIAWSRRHKFSYLRNFDPCHRRRCFWRRQHAVWTISGSRHQSRSRRRSYRQPWNNSRDRAYVNWRKCGRYTRYLRNFDGPLGLSGRRRQCFWRRQYVISSKKGWRESVITAVAVSYGACRHRLHFAISQKSAILHVHFAIYLV